jgi:hypothetical protein
MLFVFPRKPPAPGVGVTGTRELQYSGGGLEYVHDGNKGLLLGWDELPDRDKGISMGWRF